MKGPFLFCIERVSSPRRGEWESERQRASETGGRESGKMTWRERACLVGQKKDEVSFFSLLEKEKQTNKSKKKKKLAALFCQYVFR